LLNSLKKIFDHSKSNSQDNLLENELNLLTGLMIEAAYTDGKIDQNEINKIIKVLTDTFGEKHSDAELAVKECLKKVDEPKSLHAFTSKFNKSFSKEKKIILIETLWEIILEDNEIHEYESNLIRRLAGLLYISDVDCGNAKKRILNKLIKK